MTGKMTEKIITIITFRSGRGPPNFHFGICVQPADARLFETIINLFIYLTKMSYFTSQEVGSPVQIIKYVEL